MIEDSYGKVTARLEVEKDVIGERRSFADGEDIFIMEELAFCCYWMVIEWRLLMRCYEGRW